MPTVGGFKPSNLWSQFNCSTIVFQLQSKNLYWWYMIFHWQTSSKNFAILLIRKPSNLQSQFNCSTVLLLSQSKNLYQWYMIFHHQNTEGQNDFKSVAQNSSKFLLISLDIRSSWIWTLDLTFTGQLFYHCTTSVGKWTIFFWQKVECQNDFKSVSQTSTKFFAVILICQQWLDSNHPT